MPGCMKPAVTWTARPNRANLLLPSRRPEMLSASVIFSRVIPEDHLARLDHHKSPVLHMDLLVMSSNRESFLTW